jgi:hypothetical protein
MIEAFDSDLVRDVSKIWLRQAANDPPNLVWHYTKAQTLEEILESNCVQATSIKDVNDEKEFLYGQGLVEEILSQRQFELHDLGPILADVRLRIDLFHAQQDVFVFCVSEKRDCKSQWEREAVI